MIKRVCVYCASSSKVAEEYKRQAYNLGRIFADEGVEVNFGSGSVGLMGELARGVLSRNGRLTGIIPQFMVDEGWGNDAVPCQIVTKDMHERKQKMVDGVDAAVALPGGCGTMEELLEVITWKQLGLFKKPVVIVNVNEFYNPFLRMMDHIVSENFMRKEHKKIWTVVSDASEVLGAIMKSDDWADDARKYAAM